MDTVNGTYGDVELASVIGDVMEAIVFVFVAVFNGVYLSLSSSKTTSFIGFLKRSGILELKQIEEKANEEVKILTKKMMELED